jgi:hypothetical protein
MADTYTSSLRIAQQEIGANENTWGTINNAALARLDQAIAGIESISVASGNVTLTTANNSDDQARNALLIFTGSPGTTRTITFPNVEKLAWVYNNTGDGNSVTLTAGAGTTITVLSGFIACVYSDGATNMAALVNLSATVGGQIKFPATQNASADANTLDDYEEGTFTPGISFGGASVGMTYAAQNGIYTKIGNRVSFSEDVVLSNKGSSTGSARTTGLPFTASGTVYLAPHYEQINLDVAGGFYSPSCAVANGTTTVELYEQGDTVSSPFLTDADFANNSWVSVSGHYRA